MSRSSLSEKIYSILPGEQNKRIREAILAAAGYSGQRTDLLRRNIDDANRLAKGVLIEGTVEITSDTASELKEWVWVVNYEVKQPVGVTELVILEEHAKYPRPDYFIGMPDSTIVYRPSTFDQLGNSIPPTIAADEVVLRVIQRNPDGSNTEGSSDPNPDFTDTIFQTANQENTVGKYAKVWEGTLYANGNYQIELFYGATSADPDWITSAPGKAGLMVLNIFPHDGLEITGYQFYTIDPNSQAGDWVLLRTGSLLELFHYSTQYWMRVKFRVMYNNFSEVITGFKNFEEYEVLPGSDQQLNSTPFHNQIGIPTPGFGLSSNSGTWKLTDIDLGDLQAINIANLVQRIFGFLLTPFDGGGESFGIFGFDKGNGANKPKIYVDFSNYITGNGVGFELAKEVGADNYEVKFYKDTGGVRQEFGLSADGRIYVLDSLNQRGMGDAADYSATKTANDYATKKMSLPAGGTAGQVPKKQSGTDYHVAWEDESGGGGGGGHVIKSAGTPLDQRAGLNFSNQFTVSDDAVDDETEVGIDENVMATRDYVNGGATTANAASRLYLYNNY